MAWITPLIAILTQFVFCILLSTPSLAQEWLVRRPRGTLRVVDFRDQAASVMRNYAEGLVELDRNNKIVPCLAQDMRWTDDRTIEFRLRQGVTFHNGEKFDAEAVMVNWEHYRRMERPSLFRNLDLPGETEFEIVGEYIVRFTFPQPDGLALVKFAMFVQIAPA